MQETGAKRANVTRHRSSPHVAQVSVRGQRGIILVCTCQREKVFQSQQGAIYHIRATESSPLTGRQRRVNRGSEGGLITLTSCVWACGSCRGLMKSIVFIPFSGWHVESGPLVLRSMIKLLYAERKTGKKKCSFFHTNKETNTKINFYVNSYSSYTFFRLNK